MIGSETMKPQHEKNIPNHDIDFKLIAKIQSLYLDLNYSIEEISHQLRIPIYQVKKTLKSLGL